MGCAARAGQSEGCFEWARAALWNGPGSNKPPAGRPQTPRRPASTPFPSITPCPLNPGRVGGLSPASARPQPHSAGLATAQPPRSAPGCLSPQFASLAIPAGAVLRLPARSLKRASGSGSVPGPAPPRPARPSQLHNVRLVCSSHSDPSEKRQTISNTVA